MLWQGYALSVHGARCNPKMTLSSCQFRPVIWEQRTRLRRWVVHLPDPGGGAARRSLPSRLLVVGGDCKLAPSFSRSVLAVVMICAFWDENYRQ